METQQKHDASCRLKHARVHQARHSILDMMIDDSSRAFYGKAKVGALILAVCAIDTLGALNAGKKASKKTFNDFIDEYMPHAQKYSARIREGMRDRLVHNYSTDGFVYTDGNPRKHLRTYKGDVLWINVESFLRETKKAAKDYFKDLNEDIHGSGLMYQRFDNWLKQRPLLREIPDDEL